MEKTKLNTWTMMNQPLALTLALMGQSHRLPGHGYRDFGPDEILL